MAQIFEVMFDPPFQGLSFISYFLSLVFSMLLVIKLHFLP